MSDCTGTFYDGEGALAHPAVLQWSDENSDVCVVLEDLNEERRYAQEDVHVDAPLGADSPRTVVFKDGARFYTESGAQLDGLVPRGAGWSVINTRSSSVSSCCSPSCLFPTGMEFRQSPIRWPTNFRIQRWKQ